MEKEIEYLRFDCDRCGATVQFAPVGIEHMIVKHKLHPRRLIRHNPARTINQAFLKDKSMVRQSLTGGFRASQHRTEAALPHEEREGVCSEKLPPESSPIFQATTIAKEKPMAAVRRGVP